MVWRDIPGYEGFYKVSTFGTVISLSRPVKFKHSGKTRTRHTKNIFLKPNIDKYGYEIVRLFKNGVGTYKKVHRLVAEVFMGPSSLTVNHKDLDKRNNRLKNLEYLTSVENYKHARRLKKFNMPKGEKHQGAKLSDKDVLEIIKMGKLKMRHKDIAEKYPVSAGHISAIISGQRRRHYVG